MKDAPTQLDMRENTASSSRHASRSAVNSPRSISKRLPRAFQYRQQAPVLASPASDPARSINITPPEVATGEEREQSGETLPSRTAVMTAEGSKHRDTGAVCLGRGGGPISLRQASLLARAIPRRYRWSICASHGTQTQNLGVSALGTCCFRRKNESSIPQLPKPCTIGPGSPR